MSNVTKTITGWALILCIVGGAFALNEARMAIMNYALFVMIFFSLNLGAVLITILLFRGDKGTDEE